VRLTGGEPSLRRDFTDIIAAVRENPRSVRLRSPPTVTGWRAMSRAGAMPG
jgi:molybdenum cofactor biosynthesis enzyme MoaA